MNALVHCRFVVDDLSSLLLSSETCLFRIAVHVDWITEQGLFPYLVIVCETNFDFSSQLGSYLVMCILVRSRRL